jgi:hypothetical protein
MPGWRDQQLWRTRDLGQVGDRPVAAVGQQRSWPLGIPAAVRVAVVAASIGRSCCRSLVCWVNSAATITCWQVVTAWAL